MKTNFKKYFNSQTPINPPIKFSNYLITSSPAQYLNFARLSNPKKIHIKVKSAYRKIPVIKSATIF